MSALPIMVQATGSYVGKSVIAAALCRYFYRQGYRVAGRTPAKALYDLISEQWLLPPMSDAAQEVPLAS